MNFFQQAEVKSQAVLDDRDGILILQQYDEFTEIPECYQQFYQFRYQDLNSIDKKVFNLENPYIILIQKAVHNLGKIDETTIITEHKFNNEGLYNSEQNTVNDQILIGRSRFVSATNNFGQQIRVRPNDIIIDNETIARIQAQIDYKQGFNGGYFFISIPEGVKEPGVFVKLQKKIAYDLDQMENFLISYQKANFTVFDLENHYIEPEIYKQYQDDIQEANQNHIQNLKSESLGSEDNEVLVQLVNQMDSKFKYLISELFKRQAYILGFQEQLIIEIQRNQSSVSELQQTSGYKPPFVIINFGKSYEQYQLRSPLAIFVASPNSKNQWIIGKNADLSVKKDSTISGNHATIQFDQKWKIIDGQGDQKGSTNGTWQNCLQFKILYRDPKEVSENQNPLSSQREQEQLKQNQQSKAQIYQEDKLSFEDMKVQQFHSKEVIQDGSIIKIENYEFTFKKVNFQ